MRTGHRVGAGGGLSAAAVFAAALLLGPAPAGASPLAASVAGGSPPGAPPADTVESAGHASPLLPPGHWAAAAAHRLDGLGLAPAGHPRGHRRLTRRDAARAIVRAAGRESLAPGLARFLSGLLARFEAEFPAAVAAAREGTPPEVEPGGARVRAGLLASEGELLTGRGYVPGTDYEGPFRAAEPVGLGGEVDAALHLGRHLAVHGRGLLRGEESSLPELYAVGTVGPIALWGGRRSEGYGPGAGGSVVLTDPPAMEGGGLRTAEPLRLPFFLDALGPVRVSAALHRLDRNRFEVPWLLTQRFSLEPHPRFRFAATRAMMFGGQGNAPVTFGNFWTAFWGDFGGAGGEFENQVASGEFLWRLPLSPPVTAYLEYGFDDLSGGYWDTPGWVVGARLPALPGAPEASLGAEWTHFDQRCCGNPFWYRHFAFTRGWSDAGRFFAHPLGGHGDELTLHGNVLISAWNAWLEARAYRRDRGWENVFAPAWEGVSWGGEIRVEGRLDGRWEWVVEAEAESGQGGWSRERLFVGVGAVF